MNTSNIKRYAPKARNAFIASMSKMAAKYGITDKAITPMEIKGDLALIGDRPFPKSIATAREALVKTVQQHGFGQTIEKVAYSWFNRLCAIRYMELHDYLGHGRRVLSHQTEPTGYQILEECLDIDLPGLNVEKVRELKLDGTKDEALYRELLLAQCHALHTAMPFLFETIDDETELLLPENLTKTDSLIHDLVTEIPEEDWQSVEIIGWLYQFYISEKKDQVIGKVVKSEDIPAATQLFTPNWIVKYMVQNSLGAQWLATYPESPLKAQMEYYITPAEQTDEVNAQLKAITPESLNPEELTLIDPASGSGHILVEAYDLFKAIYIERGYRQRDIAQLILEKNLFGLDIDQRAAQLTGFALMMKGREDDRRLFERGVKLNVMAMVDSTSLDVDTLVHGIELSQNDLTAEDLTALKDLFEHATTFGSLIQVPQTLAEKLPALKQLSETNSQDMFVKEVLEHLAPLVEQAEILAAQYDAVVANPPYMGGKHQTPELKRYLKGFYKDFENDFFTAFICRGTEFSKANGILGYMSPQVWMFLSTFEKLRNRLINESTISSLIQPEYNAFWDSAHVTICCYIIRNTHINNYESTFIRLTDFYGAELQPLKTLEAITNRNCGWLYQLKPSEFKRIPGMPIAYWVSDAIRQAYNNHKVGGSYEVKEGLGTRDDSRFLRKFWELELDRISLNAPATQKWVPVDKAGGFRKWYGSIGEVMNWENNGEEIRTFPKSCVRNPGFFFKPAIGWGKVGSAITSFRLRTEVFAFVDAAPSAFGDNLQALLAVLNSNAIKYLLTIQGGTLNVTVGVASSLPIPLMASKETEIHVEKIATKCVNYAELDWNSYEQSWDFQSFPLLSPYSSELKCTINSNYSMWIEANRIATTEMKRLEEENNRIFIDAYGLQDELTPEVPIEQITLTVNPAYRYGVKGTEEERNIRFREDTMAELVSYAIGCMMGRYSLDEPGLIYANSGNEGFDASRYNKFPADDDGIIPLTDKEWFADDAANRLVEFISVAWDKSHLEENLDFLAENLSPKKGEDSRETIRRYLCDKFYKDHLQTYKKRPIYWLFSSGKQKAFQCLVYLHRYNEGTLARMRTEYVIPLTAKLSTHVSKLDKDIEASTSTAEIKKLEKEIAQLHKQQAELSTFDEKLRHYADQRISLDLDDGVKVNYGKFGDLLAEVKAITGTKPE